MNKTKEEEEPPFPYSKSCKPISDVKATHTHVRNEAKNSTQPLPR